MAGPRRFDHDEARRLYASGMSGPKLAVQFGVSQTAIYRVVNPAVAKHMADYTTQRLRGECSVCGQPCSFNFYQQATPRCAACYATAMATSVRSDTLQCTTCKEWKPDSEFPGARQKTYRRGRHRQCRACNTTMKREWRARNRDRDNATSRRYKQRLAA
jgi:hypothetical protein